MQRVVLKLLKWLLQIGRWITYHNLLDLCSWSSLGNHLQPNWYHWVGIQPGCILLLDRNIIMHINEHNFETIFLLGDDERRINERNSNEHKKKRNFLEQRCSNNMYANNILSGSIRFYPLASEISNFRNYMIESY